MTPRCLNCGDSIRHDDRGVLVEVVGFSRRRTQGGQNHVLLRRETGRMACGKCAVVLTTKNPGQESLL